MPIALATVVALIPPTVLVGGLARLALVKAPAEPQRRTTRPR
jgi:hypothetical protein